MNETNSHNNNDKRAFRAVEVDVPKKKRKEETRNERLRRMKIQIADRFMEMQKTFYNEQVREGRIIYQYPTGLWKSEEKYFMSYNPECLAGVYDIIFMRSYMATRKSRTVKDATMTIAYDGQRISGKVKGQLLDFTFHFEGEAGDATGKFDAVIEDFTEYHVPREDGNNYAPTGIINVLADRVACNWDYSEWKHSSDRATGGARAFHAVPECNTVEEAKAFIAKQRFDPDKSWKSNHLNLPDAAVSLIHEYNKAWTPPRPFFFFEKGDLCVQVKWLVNEDVHNESQYIARKRPAASVEDS